MKKKKPSTVELVILDLKMATPMQESEKKKKTNMTATGVNASATSGDRLLQTFTNTRWWIQNGSKGACVTERGVTTKKKKCPHHQRSISYPSPSGNKLERGKSATKKEDIIQSYSHLTHWSSLFNRNIYGEEVI